MKINDMLAKFYKDFFVLSICCFTPLLSVTDGYAACSEPVKIVGNAYSSSSIQDAYDYASDDLGLSDFTLQLVGEIFIEDFNVDGGSVLLDGGYDCSFTTKDAQTGIYGKVIISTGVASFGGDVGVVSTTACEFDNDSDGFTSIGSCAGSADDCNDNNPAIYPGALEICGDGIDQDCNGSDEICQPVCDILFCATSEDCAVAGGFWWSNDTCQGVPESETVVSADGRLWIDRNLGASQVATSLTDVLAYGEYYQWGRGPDGHQIPTNGLTWITSATDTPGHDDFILTETPPYDWRIPKNNNLWQGESGINNPCPAGFRVPTKAEWDTEIASWSSMDPAGAFASPLKLVLGGFHCHFCGEMWDEGAVGFYWSSSVYSVYAHYMQIGPVSAASTGYIDRAYGYNVRCVQD